MKGIYSTGAPLVYVLGWMDGWMGGSKSRFKDCLRYSNKKLPNFHPCYVEGRDFFADVVEVGDGPDHDLYF
jgi:hypothetical protein